jgi:hypothetical protein
MAAVASNMAIPVVLPYNLTEYRTGGIESVAEIWEES